MSITFAIEARGDRGPLFKSQAWGTVFEGLRLDHGFSVQKADVYEG